MTFFFSLGATTIKKNCRHCNMVYTGFIQTASNTEPDIWKPSGRGDKLWPGSGDVIQLSSGERYHVPSLHGTALKSTRAPPSR